jgi:hypothetical protein
MRYKPKNIDALHIALAGLPNKMRVEADAGVEISGKTVGDLRNLTTWPDNLVITTPHHHEAALAISKATIATRWPTKR